MSMKTICEFCKTEYTLDKAPSAPVKCAVCGHRWVAKNTTHRNTTLVFIASLCALLAAIVFTVVAVTHYSSQPRDIAPLVATITNVSTATDTDGVPHVIVSGHIENRSDDIYGVPDLTIVLSDASGNVLNRQRFMPTATLLDPGATAEFSHTLSQYPAGVKHVSAELELGGGANK